MIFSENRPPLFGIMLQAATEIRMDGLRPKSVDVTKKNPGASARV
jgi:hypothetical protein